MRIWASPDPRGTLVCVGSELLRGKVNTHVSTLAQRLAAIGIDLHAEHTVGDDLQDLALTIRHALDQDPVVIVTGGLGPTFDDLTREAAAQATSRRLIRSTLLLSELHRKFRRARYGRMPPENARQADVLEGAVSLPNVVGTAPGQWLEVPLVSRMERPSPRVLILLPGPPAEMEPMLEKCVLPRLRKRFPAGARAEAHLHFVGIPESVVNHRVLPVVRQCPGTVSFTILARLGLVDLDVFVHDRTRHRAESRVAGIVRTVRRRMGAACYGVNDEFPLERVVGSHFLDKGATLAVAESCTGGLLAKTLTDIPGSSRYFMGGVVCYSNALKQKLVGVAKSTLIRYGAVSREVAAEMAEGIRRHTGTTIGMGITGIAGPAGGSSRKPVGLVYIGLSARAGTRVLEYRFRGARQAIRQRSLIAALDLLRRI